MIIDKSNNKNTLTLGHKYRRIERQTGIQTYGQTDRLTHRQTKAD